MSSFKMTGSHGSSSDGSEHKVKDVRDDRFRTDNYSTTAPDRSQEKQELAQAIQMIDGGDTEGAKAKQARPTAAL